MKRSGEGGKQKKTRPNATLQLDRLRESLRESLRDRLQNKWLFYGSLILLESFIIFYPLVTAFSPTIFFEEGRRVSFLFFIAAGAGILPILISKKSSFRLDLGSARLRTLLERLPVFNILYVIFGISLLIRTVLPYDRVFVGGGRVMFGSDDPVYHVRLVENLLFGGHYPHRIFFDPYTLYPHGDHLHFAPLFDQIPAFFTWLLGLGAPTQELMETVLAYYPAVLGALVVFPVYFIGKELYSRAVGLVSAFLIAILPGFLFRSILGAADHHVAELLFSTVAMLFLVLALKEAKACGAGGVTFEQLAAAVAKRDFSSLRKVLVFIFLAGFSFGLYALTWVGCVLFVFIVFVALFAQFIFEHLRGNSTDYLCIVGVPVFLIPLLMISPFLNHSGMYSSVHTASMLIGAVVVLVLSATSSVLARRKVVPYAYLFVLLAEGIAILVVLRLATPSLYASFANAFGWVKYGIAMEVLGEMHPMTLDAALRNFSTCFYISLAGFGFVIYSVVKKWRAEETLFLVWSFINLLILGVIFDMLGISPPPIGMSRFVYYYAVNVALLCGLFAVRTTRLGFDFFSSEMEGGAGTGKGAGAGTGKGAGAGEGRAGGGIKYVIAGGINFFPGTLKLLKDLREMGVSVFVASGDRIEREEMAAYLPDVPPENLFGMMKPEDKRDLVRRLKEKQTVVMVGDDRNDYLAMCEADISVLSLQEEADRPGAILEIADFRIKKIGEVKGIIEEMRECVSKQGEGGAREGGARGGEVKW